MARAFIAALPAFRGVAVLLGLLVCASATRAAEADGTTFSGRWTTAEGDVIEFQFRDPSGAGIGVLVEPRPAGLGRFFKPGTTILRDVKSVDGQLACTLQEGEWKTGANAAARTIDTTLIGGPAQGAVAADTGEVALRWQPIRRRHFLDEDGWFLRAERLAQIPPQIVVTLQRAPMLTLFLVRGEELEPAVALFYGVPYVAELTTRDRRLPLTVPIQLTAGGEKLVVEGAAIADGVERRYRSKPFVLRMSDDGLPPATQP